MEVLLRAIFLQHAGLPFRISQLEGNMELGICAGELRAAVPFLLRKEKLEIVKNKSGEVLLRINEESLAMLTNEWVAGALISYDPFSIVINMDAGEGLMYRILNWLAWIYYNGLPLTNKGNLFRKTIDALKELTPFEDEKLKGLQLQLTAQEDLPVSIAFMLDILVKMSVLRLEAGEWKIQDESLRTWLKLDLKAANKKLLTILCENYVPARKYQQQIVALLTCARVQQGEICILDNVVSRLPRCPSNTIGLKEEQTLWLNSWLYVLAQCGWLEQGKLVQNTSVTVVRWHEEQFEFMHETKQNLNVLDLDQSIIVQPDFEILVPPEVPLAIRYKLELFTECVRLDVMSQYRLTKRKFCLALESGLSWQLQIDLPAHIEMAIAEWTREVNLNQANNAPIGNSKSKSNSISNSKSISKNIAKSTLQSRMTNAGCFVQPNPPLPSYEIGVEAPDFTQAFPDFDTVPLKWREQLSSYHPSTLKHLIEQAITWQIKVELQWGDQRVSMIPNTICDESDGWRVVGIIPSFGEGEPVLQSIPNKQCYGAKLLVPDIDSNNVSTFYSDSCNNML
jgi:hypothetical protein